ncbi:MAG: hypothetical protein M3P91_07530 [Actinomycetota bacterium]|nr:hypothetical protein [Actinomycetota bacterium]
MDVGRAVRPLAVAGALASAVSVLLIVTVAALGPSAAVPQLPGAGSLPWHLDAAPDPILVATLHTAAILLGAAGTLACWAAVGRGWAPRPRRLIAAGAMAVGILVPLPPVGSADVLIYAAYGRIAATGADPYRTEPYDYARAGDPVAKAVLPPWRRSASAYGPLATAEQRLIAEVAGPSPRRAVALLMFVNGAAFLAAGLLLDRVAARRRVRGRDGPDHGSADSGSAESEVVNSGTADCEAVHARRRVALLWTANPLLLHQLVAGGHLDAIVVVAVAGGLLLLARSGLLAGAALGAAAA